MRTISKILIMACLLFAVKASAQTEIKDLKVGDTIPELVLKTLIGHDKPVKLSSLHQQDLLIIDFWATWCSPCVKELSTLDSLVVLNHGRLVGLSVAYESRATIMNFLKQRPDVKTSHLNMLTDDKTLIEYFKHRVIPHNIWIDKYGVVKHITGGEEVNQQNIIAFFSNSKMQEHEKNDILNFNYWAPFHLRDSVFSYRSIETPNIPGLCGGQTCCWVYHHPTEQWLNRLFAYDSSIEQLLWIAINRTESTQNFYGTMKILTKDSLRFYFPEQCRTTFAKSKYKSREDWKVDNLYCYELTLPKAAKDSVFFPYMLNDLERIFDIKVYTQIQNMPVCVLSLDPGKTFAIPTNDSTYINVDHDHLQAHNVTLKYLCEYLNRLVKADINDKSFDPPYVDETGINSRIDIDVKFETKVITYADLQKYITQKCGIHFNVEERNYPVTIVKDLAP